MRILITGATGFLGSQVVARAAQEPVEIGAIVRPGANLWRLGNFPANVALIRGDLRERDLLVPEIRNFKPDAVIHTAWSGVGNKFRNDPAQIEENLLPTVNLLRAAAEAGSKTFVGLGSQAEYGPLNRKTSEADQTEPTTLYGAAKLATCVLLKQLCEQMNVRFAWLRVFSTYGPMEDPGWLIPYLAQSLLNGERPALTAGEQKWDYLYGKDAAEAIWDVTRNEGAKGIFNLGSGQVYTLRRIVEMIRDLVDPKLGLGFGEVPYRPDQVMHLEADIRRLQEATGWRPKIALEQGLKETVAWWRSRSAT